ncbi:MAG TPA: N-acetylmuramoyl-L-alanine amidase [Vicinamibacterales bacterium]|jgi:N-acetylmuramoyl-L-alanine amidase|nr:N-acetylmuramoyl-L-alanine amidase [Vicinamibacterales bacterium]
MVKSTLLLALTACAAIAAAPPVRTMYNDALAREQVVRPALAVDDPAPTVLTDVRAAIARYEAVVRRYPASGYSDNALWQGAHLALDAFEKFGQPKDRETGLRLLRQLATMFPTSRLARKVPQELERVGNLEPAHAATVEPAHVETVAPPGSRAADRSGLATIKEIRRSILPDAVRIVIELDGEVDFRQDRIESPSRVFLDLPATKAAPPLVDRTLRFETDADVVRQVRIGRHPNNTTRVVLDAAGVSSYSVYPMYSPYRLVIDCVRAGALSAAAPLGSAGSKPVASKLAPSSLDARPAAPVWLRTAPSNAPQHGVLLAEAHSVETEGPARPSSTPRAPAVPAPPAAAPSPAPGPSARPADAAVTPPDRNGNGGFSIARQLGLGVSRIVIDAGHGGHDPGAQARGIVESELTLDIALRLEKLLQKTPGVDVVLTRRTDEFVALQDRTAIANREGADLFLSIHANASPSAQAHGIETYFLNFASNLSAAAVAARENAASGQAMNALPDIVKAIALNNKLDESRDFASAVQHAMLDQLRASNKLVKDLGVKQAPFVVLIGAAMPSVLAEISFLTNPQEAKLLKGHAYRQRIAEALFDAIRKYQISLKSTTTVASQQQ